MKIDTVQTVPLLDWSDLTPDEQAEFDWMSEDEQSGATLFRYRDRIFSVSEFMVTTNPELQDAGWIGIHTDTFFSATVCKMPDFDEDEITVGFAMNEG